MGLCVKRSFKISKSERLELDEKGVGIDFGNIGIEGMLNIYKNKKICEESKSIKKDKVYNEANKKDIIRNEKDEKILYKNYNEFLEELVTIHKRCVNKIDWNSINSTELDIDAILEKSDKSEAVKEYEDFTPTFFEKIFKFLGEKRKEELLKVIEKEEKYDKDLHDGYEKMKMFSQNILDGDITSYFQLIDELSPFDEMIECGSQFEIGSNDKSSFEVEFKVNSEKVIPREILELDENNKVIRNSMSDTEYYELVQDYTCSCTLKIAKDLMNLLAVDKVVVHAVDNVIDYDTKAYKDITILSIVFDRKTLEKLNFNSINPSDALDEFICNIRPQKAEGFKSVDRILNY